MSDVMEQPQAEKKAARVMNYRVFRQDEGGRWVDLGVYPAKGTTDAKKQAVEQHNLQGLAREGTLKLAAPADRYWNVTEPKAEPQPDRITY